MAATSAPIPADRRWRLGIAGAVALGIACRAVYVLVILKDVPPGLDAIWYQLQGGSLRNGTGFVVPTSLFEDQQVPTAGFPPVYPLYQALWQWVVSSSPTSVRLAGIVPGAITIVVVALAGRDVAGRRVGLIAAFVLALDPGLMAVDGSTMSENVTVPLVAIAIWLAYRVAVRGARPVRIVALGLVCGVAALSRQDLLLLVPLAVVPAVAWAPDVKGWRRLASGAGAVLLVALVVVPWAWRNHREVGSFTVSTLSPSSALAGSNCDEVYAGSDLGSWSYPCVAAVRVPPGTTEAELADAQQRAAARHARQNLARLPLVVAAREARVWGLWDPRDLARRDAAESRRYGWQLGVRPLDALMAVTGTAGLVLLVRERGRRALLFMVPLVLVVVTAALSHGNPRFNSISHPSLAIGLAFAADRLLARWRTGASARGAADHRVVRSKAGRAGT